MTGALLGALFGSGAVVSLSLWRNLIALATSRSIAFKGIHVESQQISLGVVASIAAGVVCVLIDLSVVLSAGLILAAFGIGLWAYQEMRAATARELDLKQSLLVPAFVDALALAVSTGLPTRAALHQVLSDSDSELQQLWIYLLDNPEIPLVPALAECAARCSNAANERVMHSVIVATERGTPLTDVLQALASEQRAEGRRVLLELAAKKDVIMMLPVVFGILPSITAVALYPAVSSLSTLN